MGDPSSREAIVFIRNVSETYMRRNGTTIVVRAHLCIIILSPLTRFETPDLDPYSRHLALNPSPVLLGVSNGPSF